jgi:hypothetical protein
MITTLFQYRSNCNKSTVWGLSISLVSRKLVTPSLNFYKSECQHCLTCQKTIFLHLWHCHTCKRVQRPKYSFKPANWTSLKLLFDSNAAGSPVKSICIFVSLDVYNKCFQPHVTYAKRSMQKLINYPYILKYSIIGPTFEPVATRAWNMSSSQ